MTVESDEQHSEDGDSTSVAETEATDAVDDLPDGAGCTEIWEHLSEKRADESD